MENPVRQMLYQTRHHASRPFIPNYPPQQANEAVKGGLLSLLSARGVTQLKEKWSEYRNPRKIKRFISLFVSPRGKRVAVASGNQITILQDEDDYQEPCGIFSSTSLGTFTSGIWSECHDILGVVDDTGTLYFIKANGDEITRVTMKHLKISSPVIGLIANDDSDIQRSVLCIFTIVTSDGSLQHIEISQNPSAPVSSSNTSNKGLTLMRQLPNNIFCFDYHPELSLLVVGSSVNGNSGFSISLWRINRVTDVEQLFSTQFDGVYSKPKGYRGQLAYPKVLISPQGRFIATLDVTGCLHFLKLDEKCCKISSFYCIERDNLQVTNKLSNGGKKVLSDIVDFAWWSDHILTIVKGSGTVMMLDILSGLKVQESDPVYSMSVAERVHLLQGHLFLLETTSSDERYTPCNNRETDKSLHIELITEDGFNQFDISKLRWRLVSFTEISVPEMYTILISNKRYKAALDFANCHMLDKDEVLKSQWLNSDMGINEINTLLSNIKDTVFVLSECVDKVGATEDSVRALLAYGLRLTNQYRFSVSEDHECSQIWDFRMARLQLLQFKDRLETYLGINMGRFSMQEYCKFRVMPISETAVTLAESGKVGALNLLFKRHPYSLASSMLEILAAIPETVPVQTYGQLLPGRSPPTSIAVREEDWVECENMIHFINKLPEDHEIGVQMRTEPILSRCLGSFWPPVSELSLWYKNRARDIDSFSGLLDNSLCLVDFACCKGISELQQFLEDISYLNQLIYSNENDGEINYSMCLVEWEQLSAYDKFRIMLKGVKEEIVVERLRDKAIPFMRSRFDNMTSVSQDHVLDNQLPRNHKNTESYLVRWMKEIAMENKLEICLMVIEEGCRDLENDVFFMDEIEAVDCALHCIYLCAVTDRWNTMAAMISKLPQMQDTRVRDEGLEKRLKQAEGHIEAGRVLAFYQVPKPMKFFLEAHADEKGVKQILRLILSKFSRRLPSRSDNDWANMWRDMQCLHEKAFPFLDLEYMLMEYCRGLLKAGKFSLARNYLKGTGSVALASEKAENLVIQSAREYFFSASSLACSEIWKAKECLNLFPSSRNVKAESDIIEALTLKLPYLGVTLLPMQFRQIKDPMEIIKMAITSQAGAYLHVDELIEVAKLLGLNSFGDISTVEEAIAREAAVAGDLQFAFDLCIVLAKKGHGLIWDLCAAIARGPALENMTISSRKQLLGFALSHCDEESIGELLHAWKDLDVQGQCETLMMLTGRNSPNFSVQGSSTISFPVPGIDELFDLKDGSQLAEGFGSNVQEVNFSNIKKILSVVAKNLPVDNATTWESLLTENRKILSFAALQLPWLVELTRKTENGRNLVPGLLPVKQYSGVRTQGAVTILSWLARNGFAPQDNLISTLAKSIIDPPVTEEEDIIGCSFLLNLVDAFNGVEVIEEQLRIREDYQEVSSIMSVGMTYSVLHNSGVECGGPAQRRELLLRKFKEKYTPLNSDKFEKIDKAQSTFWREWKLKLEEQKCVADQSRALEKIIPGVETARFLSRDLKYIESVLLSIIDSVKSEKKSILKDVLKLADTYGLNHTEVLLRYLNSVLISEVWAIDDIQAEISEVKGEILCYASETINTISLIVYPAIDGCHKQRLAYIYGLLAECYVQLDKTTELLPIIHSDTTHVDRLGLAHFYKVLEQECGRVSFIKNLNFKNITGLDGLNLECFSSEVCRHIDASSLEPLAKMVQTLVGIYTDPVPRGLILWQDVYKHYVLGLLTILESRAQTDFVLGNPENLQGFISQLEHTYDICRMYIRLLAYSDAFDIMKRYLTIMVPLYDSFGSLPDNSMWQECLIILLNFWIRLTDEMRDIASFDVDCLMSCLKIFMKLVVEDSVSPSQGWVSIVGYVNNGLTGDFAVEIFRFCRAMVTSGCSFGAVTEVFSEGLSRSATNDTKFDTLPHLYLKILEPLFEDLITETLEHKNLYNLLSSLSRLEGDLEELKRVRHAVWQRMAKFSDNLQLPSNFRVYVLELMQCITDRIIKGSSVKLQSNVLPWEGWDELHFTIKKGESSSSPGLPNQSGPSIRFSSTLVALKSCQLMAAISTSIEITPDDLSNVETAVTCFLKLCEAANTHSHFDALLAILREWEGLFVIDRNEEASPEASDAGNIWSNDDWDEGWESFQEVEPHEKEKNYNSWSIHPLHACWIEIFKKLIRVSRFRDVLRLIDQSLSKSNIILLDEDSARTLSQIVLEIDCFMALKMVLLLPYESIHLQCLGAVEEKLKEGGISDSIGRDLEFLVIILSSGAISTIFTKTVFSTTISYLCYLVGNLSRQCLESQFSKLTQKSMKYQQTEDQLFVFRKIIFPCFLSELVKADQQILAGFVVTKFMHTHASLSLINVTEASLSRYFQRELQVLQHDEFALEQLGSCETLKNSVFILRSKLENLIQSSLSLLPCNAK